MNLDRSWCAPTTDGVRLSVQVTPNARKNEVVGVQDDILKIKLHALPIEGKANEALIRFIADRIGLPQKAVTLVHGQQSRRKLLEVRSPGLTVEAAKAFLIS